MKPWKVTAFLPNGAKIPLGEFKSKDEAQNRVKLYQWNEKMNKFANKYKFVIEKESK